MPKSCKFRLVWYQYDAVYEPAEGGYYVPISDVESISEKVYGMNHAIRKFRMLVNEYSAVYGEPALLTKTCARWRIGPYIGSEIELRIESESCIGRHAVQYHGYC